MALSIMEADLNLAALGGLSINAGKEVTTHQLV
jgi:hypothetical protein